MEIVLINKIINNPLLEYKIHSDSSDDDSVEDIILLKKYKQSHIKIESYVTNVVNYYTLSDFRSHFRMTRTTIETLIASLHLKNFVTTPGRPKVPVLDAVLLTIWVLANQESFRGISDRFGFSRGHAHTIFIKICKNISRRVKHFIIWPRGQSALENMNTFNNLRGPHSFPNVFACIDCTHIAIPGPATENSYYNRKGYHSIILQGVCNAKQQFIDIYCGWPGSAHDSRVWQNSPLYEKILADRHNILPNNSYIIGDSAYPLTTFLLTPFKDNGHLSPQQRHFNKKLSSTRVLIEQCFGRLKATFRRLRYLYIVNLSYAKYIIFTACILYNVILKYEGVDENDFIDENIADEIGVHGHQVHNIEAEALRMRIMNNLV